MSEEAYNWFAAMTIHEHLKNIICPDVPFYEEEGTFVFNISIDDEHGNMLPRYLTTQVHIHNESMVFRTYCPIGPSRWDDRALYKTAAFVCRANSNMANGKFEFNMDKGEIVFSSFLSFVDQVPSMELVEGNLKLAANMYHRYFPGLVMILFQNEDPRTAIHRCETDWNDRQDCEEEKEEEDIASARMRRRKESENQDVHISPRLRDFLNRVQQAGPELDDYDFDDDDVFEDS